VDRDVAAIHGARAAARAAVWRLSGEHAPDQNTTAGRPLIDVDATLVTAHSDKENTGPNVQTRV
jgi:hypothetical protein